MCRRICCLNQLRWSCREIRAAEVSGSWEMRMFRWVSELELSEGEWKGPDWLLLSLPLEGVHWPGLFWVIAVVLGA